MKDVTGQSVPMLANEPMPIPSPKPAPSPQNMQELLSQMRRELIEELKSAVRDTQKESLEQHRVFIKESLEQHRILIIDQEVSLQKMISRRFAQGGEITQVIDSNLCPEQDRQSPTLADLERVEAEKIAARAKRQVADLVAEEALENPEQPDDQNAEDPDTALVASDVNGDAEMAKDDAGPSTAPTGRGSTWINDQPKTVLVAKNPHRLHHESGIFVTIVHSHWFFLLTLGMICINALYIGIAADYNKAASLADSAWYWQLCENFFTIFFLVELICHFGAFKTKMDCLQDRWFMFDFFMVSMMVIETWIFTILVSFLDNPPNTGAVGGIGRMLRLLRLTRISRIMQMVPELVTMVKGMIAAIRAVHAALAILLLLVYVFAIIMNALVGDVEEMKVYFETVRDSMVTLIVQGVLLDEISGLVHDMLAVGNFLSIVSLMIFILLSALTVMNMLIGVLCQVVLDVSAEEKENNVKDQMAGTLLVMLRDLDDDQSGELSKSEFQDVIREPDAIAVLRDIQVDTQHLLDLTEMLYAGEGTTLPISVIMNIVLALRGKRPITMDDLAKGHNFLLWALESQLAEHRGILMEEVQAIVRAGPARTEGFVAISEGCPVQPRG